MKVILTKNVPKLGQAGDVITVKDGYARNFILPLGKGVIASATLLKKAEVVRSQRVQKSEMVAENAKKIAEDLKGASISFKKKANEDKLYGSITESDVIEALLKDYKVEISKDMVKMDHIKTTGSHKITLQLNSDTKVEIAVNVEAEA